MDPYREANAPPPPYPHHEGPPLPPYVPPHGAKFHEAGSAGGYNPPYPPPQQPGYPPQPQMYQQQQQQQHGYQPVPQHGYPAQQFQQQGQQYQPQPPPRQTATVVVAPSSVGQHPMRIKCPSCQADIRSRVRRSNALKTHFVAVLLCLLCCWPCICVPYCMASCKDATHSCPNCKAFLGTYRA